ncbi:hypothetical protein BBI01_17070 [Chryseobacterium artocarpi]|uniref:Uncharacterized protein n=1 Tax=Chryseobacterium artocarpi TaxID=1414727 RepID=A0A1B8ZBC5_9FLAO|nr:hypothetical protein [Chryseobacterium artocarpi]OCA68929.1 hypothetical protein BBI01_17070 [Chryseobacterium artocarpi]
MFKDADIIEILESNLPDIHIDLLDIKISMTLRTANKNYQKNIQNISMSVSELDNIYKENIGLFNSLNPDVKNRIK